MQIVSVEIGYDQMKKILELPPEAYTALRERFVGIFAMAENQPEFVVWGTNEFVGVMEDVEYLTGLGIKCSISRVRGTFVEVMPELGVIEAKGPQVINLMVPNAGLFSVKKLKVLQDECTDSVQGYLDRGWRIVAVCPPNDTRRPTYILGNMENVEL